jgi:exonuclease VII small subunit
MKRFLMLLACAFMAVSTVGCGETDEQKNQEQSKDLVRDFKNLAVQMDKMGSPNANWSDADITKYENILNKMQRILDRANSMNGEGVLFSNLTEAQYLITHNRQVLENAKTAKALMPAAAAGASASTNQTKEQLTAQVQNLEQKYLDLVKELDLLGKPDESWSLEKIDQVLEKFDEVDVTLSEMISIFNKSSAYAKTYEQKKALQEGQNSLTAAKKVYDEVRQYVNQLRARKSVAA